MNGEETRPLDPVMEHFANSSFRLNLLPMMLGGASPSGTKRCPSVNGNLPFR